ncbi:DNA polymerase III subunit gamma/tau [Parabacteroides sp. Marseille-P3160]|uniref:DNA polymerase III subunit gamma/tau n=1 Tax=Parabacteroides sp. Marseille-P3160 TaxID=1917887 RepID=UPI0009BA6825|nr:DNA polymerase III subunit gamma/tau [Parabacteroides sp. Marseille-P3160]
MDNYIVSARKYRPSTFQSVVGQKSLTTTLRNAILTNKLAHAYLFCGPRGVGKTSCARIFAKTINCMNLTPEGEACNECESCRAFNEQRSLNIHELDAASNNSVDDIRSLIDQVRIPPQLGKYKVYIIDEVHMLSPAAFNAFLKTLEEPPHHAIFILATTEKHKILPTILSRCQIYDFSRISVSDVVEHLQYVASCEGVTAEPEALNVIAQKADGGMRDALSIFDQVVSFTGGNITYRAVIENLNVLDYEYFFRLTEAILNGNVRECLLILNEIISHGFEGQNIITGLAAHFRDLLVCRDEATLVLFEVGSSIRERYKEMAKRCPEAFLFKAIELCNTCDLNYRNSRNKRLLLELTLIQLCQLNRPTTPSPADSSQKHLNPLNANAKEDRQSPSASPQAPATSQAASSDARPTVVTTHIPSSASMPSSPSATPKRTTHAPIGASLKEIGSVKPKAQVVQETQVVDQKESFTQEDLQLCWDEFSETIEQKVHLKNTMINNKPVLLSDSQIEVPVYNPGQQDELLNNSLEILSYLRSHLRNTHIQMSIRILETNENQKAYTSTDKFKLLSDINPTLLKLKDEFNLSIE